MIKIYSVSILLVSILFFSSSHSHILSNAKGSVTVISVLEQKGLNFDKKRANTSIKGVSAEVGKELFHEGFASKPNGGKTRKQSKHFVCSSCHNVEKEDPDLSIIDAQARLEYTNEKGLPFVQGSTMYGVVNRTTYYNGDYEKKYGELVNAARNDIRGAIQLCATECAQGRALKDWELESVLAYLWTLDLKLEDIGLDSISAKNESVEGIQARYLSGSPATFIPPPADRKEGAGLVGRPENGKLIYENGCLHCHLNGKYSFLNLDTSRLSFKHLNSRISGYSRHSIYQVIRWGVPTKSGKKSYMPQYTEEKMSDQQLEDLRAFIELKAD